MANYGELLKVSMWATITELILIVCSATSLEHRHITSEADIENAFALGEYIKKGMLITRWLYSAFDARMQRFCITETLALYSLAKYRHLRRAYPPSDWSS